MMLLSYITWDPSPEIFRIGGIAVRWYGLMWALSFMLGYIIMQRFYKEAKLTVEELDKFSLYIIIGSILGARLGHVMFYQPDYYLRNPLEILMIWQGGLASHGGAIGILLAVWLFTRKKSSRPYFWVLDRLVIVVALAGMFIRLGNLMNSEMIGKETDVSWAFIFPAADPLLLPRHPAQIYEALAYLFIFIVLLLIYYRKKFNEGFIFGLFLLLLFSARFMLEYFKEVQVMFEQGMVFNMGQLLSIPFIIIGIFVMIRSIRYGKPGYY